MKMIILSDIHGISSNIKILSEQANLNIFNYIIILGDIFNSIYSTSDDKNTIIKFLQKYKDKLIVVRGNTDTKEDILKIPTKVEDIKYLKIDDIDFYFTHGHIYNFYNNNAFSNGVMIYGHEHIPYIKKESDMTYINVGSISLPRDDNGKTYAVYEDGKIIIYKLENNNPIIECDL